MKNTQLIDEYFDWLVLQIDLEKDESKCDNCSWVLKRLFEEPFTWSVPFDENRAKDGLELRRDFAREECIEDDWHEGLLDPSCSILEMMIALAIRMENEFMFDPDFGDRTAEWFWIMMCNLGLDSIENDRYDEAAVDEIINIFLYRQYSFDGEGGLFYVENSKFSMKKIEIWQQMMLFSAHFLKIDV